MSLDPIGGLRHLRSERSDWLLTVLAGVLALLIFVIAPLQAIGIYAFHLSAICLLLAIIGGMVLISNSPTALVLMSIVLVANIAMFFLRLYYPVPFHLHILAAGRVPPGDRYVRNPTVPREPSPSSHVALPGRSEWIEVL